MDFTERKQKLQSFKSTLSSKKIDASTITSFEKEISSWKFGVSQTGYENFISKVISKVEDLEEAVTQINSDIDSRIQYLEQEIEHQFNSNKYLLYSVNSNGGKKKKAEINTEIRQKIINADLDSTVQRKLLSLVY
jgi:hypothetical protein